MVRVCVTLSKKLDQVSSERRLRGRDIPLYFACAPGCGQTNTRHSTYLNTQEILFDLSLS
jgi:hypothetical protein